MHILTYIDISKVKTSDCVDNIYTKHMQVYVKSIYSYIQLHVTVEMNTTS